MWLFYLKSSVRSIRRKQFFSILNVAGLAVGITIFLLSLEFFSYETGFNRFHNHLGNLYRVGISGTDGKTAAVFPPLAPLMQKHIPGVHRAVRLAPNFNDGAIISWQPDSANTAPRVFREDDCIFADAAFLDAFNFPMVEGTNGLDQTNTVVITTSVKKQLFGEVNAIGKTIVLHNQFGQLPVRVTGVTADIPAQSDIRFRYLFSIHILDDPKYTEGSDWARLTTWGNDSYNTFVWLDPQADPTTVASTATRLWQQNDPEYAKKRGAIFLQPVKEMHLGAGWNDDNPSFASYGLANTVLLLGILVLVIAWINYINFATADALTRAKEIGIHKVTGSSTSQIAWRSVTESTLLNLSGIGVAIILTGIVQGLFNYVTGKPLALSYIANQGMITVAIATLVAGSLVCGAYTGLLLSRLKPITAIHLNNPGKLGHSLVRKGLVIFQLAVSCLFIALTLVAFQQVRFMKHQDLGMNLDRLIVIDGPVLKDSTFKTKSTLFRTELARLPFVNQFSCSGSVPGIGSGHNFSADGITGSVPRTGDDRTAYSISEVDENFFPTYQIPLLFGSNFSQADADKGFQGDRLIINETAARTLGYEPSTAVGKLIRWGKPFTIVGIARDYHHRSLKEPIEPIIYIPVHNNSHYTIKTDFSGLKQKMASIETLYTNLYPGNSFNWRPLQETFDQLYADDQRTGVIALSLSVLVIVISGLGLVGLAAFTARRRTKEMGIRKVLGASTPSLFVQMSREYIWLVLIAFIIATPVARIATRQWLDGFAYRIHPGWPIFAMAGFLCLCFTLLTITFHTLKTSLENPIRQLRTD
ncbi:MAG TPA: ABC transporter permease [Puia sp.]|uniref:ABC transporter permease n=1 Tax=Puia sp. TaxID=2045100 RepID=UPI002C3CD171|nr:ABC transporter permease [Puia sp.]HVU98517.1 ABC transporter permease [Puia sp.]